MTSIYSTKTVNKDRLALDKNTAIWLFGYGSIIFKVDFDYLQVKKAYLHGWERRFWMASEDHRGTPQAPGRVLTLTPSPDSICFGLAYQIEHEVLEALDHREQNGYLRHLKFIRLENNEKIQALVYIGDTNSPIYIEQHDIRSIAQHIHKSVGPSGKNAEYVFKLADGLRLYEQSDDYIFTLEDELKRLAQT